MTEEERAAEYRRQMRARARHKRATERALTGSPAAKKAVEDATAALLAIDANGVPRVGLER